MKALLQQIRAAIDACRTNFVCSGKVSIPDGLTLFAKIPAQEANPGTTAIAASVIAVDFPLAAPTEDSLRPLIDTCLPASFGRGSEDVLDPAYRNALVLPTSNVSIRCPSLDLTAILPIVFHSLVDPKRITSESNIRAEFHKVNVYGPQGFFKAHVDTPRANGMFGSLVLALPCPHSGGELVLRRTNKQDEVEERMFGWGQEQGIGWAAFLSATEHEVLPVTQGYRVTLTYNLYLEGTMRIEFQTSITDSQMDTDSQELDSEMKADKESKAEAAPDSKMEGDSVDPIPRHEEKLPPPQPCVKNSIYDVLYRALSSPDFYPRGGRIGIHLDQKYAVSPWTMARSVIPHLRGPDLLLYRALEDLKGQFNVDFDLRYLLEFDNSICCGQKILVLTDCQNRPDCMRGDDPWDESDWSCSEARRLGKRLDWLKIDVMGTPHKNTSFGVTAFGNQATTSSIYASIMIVVEINNPKALREAEWTDMNECPCHGKSRGWDSDQD